MEHQLIDHPSLDGENKENSLNLSVSPSPKSKDNKPDSTSLFFCFSIVITVYEFFPRLAFHKGPNTLIFLLEAPPQ